MKLSVVILSYNVRYFLELCIKSVQAAITDLDAEIIVVDNYSSDDSCEMVRRLFPTVRLIENSENLGFSKGNNIGVAQAKGKYICILNPDTVVAEDTFKMILAHAETNSKIGLLGCQLLDGRGQFLPESKRNIPTPMVSLKKILGFPNAYYASKLSANDIGNVEVLVGAFMFLRKAVYDEVNGFDEDYFMYGEDIDLSYKVLKAGYKNVYFGKTSVLHYKGESTLKDGNYAKHFYGAMQIFYHKHFKTNLVFDVFVRFGILFSRLFMKKYKPIDSVVAERVLVTAHSNLNIKLPFHITISQDIVGLIGDKQVVFDGNTLGYNEIIQNMISLANNKGLTFRILPKDSFFIIGSDSSQQHGEVILL